MVYRVIGLMSGSSLDGLDIAFVELHENAGNWNYEILAADCYPYPAAWAERLHAAVLLPALEYQLLHADFGHYTGQQVKRFIAENGLDFQVALVASHGHTTFHIPARNMTAQLGDGAAIAAETGLPVVTDLRGLDVALGGQGAPIVPIGEKLLLGNYNLFLNLGGIANISGNPAAGMSPDERGPEIPGQGTSSSLRWGFDVCPANKVLNMLANDEGKEFDEGGQLAASGTVNDGLLKKLNALDYYHLPYPKSLANDFGTGIVYPMIKQAGLPANDALRTYVEHITEQLKNAIINSGHYGQQDNGQGNPLHKLLVTGGGAFNSFLIERLRVQLTLLNIEVVIPEEKLVKYKEALIMALIGVLRWRQEYNILSSITGATRDSIGGALWNGQD